MVLLFDSVSDKTVAFMLSNAAGVMLTLSSVDLIYFNALRHGYVAAVLLSVLGVILYLLIDFSFHTCVPESYIAGLTADDPAPSPASGRTLSARSVHNTQDEDDAPVAVDLESGAYLRTSTAVKASTSPANSDTQGVPSSVSLPPLGSAPSPSHASVPVIPQRTRAAALRSRLLTALVLSIHNLPEGTAQPICA